MYMGDANASMMYDTTMTYIIPILILTEAPPVKRSLPLFPTSRSVEGRKNKIQSHDT